MKNLTRQLLYKGDNAARANVIWNIAGSFVYALRMVLSFWSSAWREKKREVFSLWLFYTGTAVVF